jgi:hypothetical protein
VAKVSFFGRLRSPKIAVPTRTNVAPSSTASLSESRRYEQLLSAATDSEEELSHGLTQIFTDF